MLSIKNGIYLTEIDRSERVVVVCGNIVQLLGSSYSFTLNDFFKVNDLVKRLSGFTATFTMDASVRTKTLAALDRQLLNLPKTVSWRYKELDPLVTTRDFEVYDDCVEAEGLDKCSLDITVTANASGYMLRHEVMSWLISE